jgi:hypothetical protein
MEQSQEQERPKALKYPAGWQEILTAPDAEEYQHWLMNDVVPLSMLQPELEIYYREELLEGWKRAIETIADVAMMPDDPEEMTEAETVELAIVTMRETIGTMGWEESGISLVVPNLETGEDVEIDIREYL